ncbi:MAG TPA: cysteine--tRNA ligase [Candidatus Sulfomarinibacteraceae bacterium]|nr:cysteine--tRNA ligase [Candidatus Sulfomarinibacteraceae bacterium]
MQLYNALTREKEQFEPAGEAVTIYVCGITPYDTTHLGHLFTYASFDALIRYLELKGHTVRYVQNVTDIDDDILRKAAEVGDNWREVGDRWTAHFIRDMKALNMRPPDYFPRATDVIEEMIEVVQELLAGGYAYEKNGNVYFHIDSWEAFGRLSQLPRGEMLAIANERGNHPDDPNKKDPLDFVLWQAQAPGEPAWDSPWGPGRPGWHIECSTMACHYLGNTIDIHGGGADLMFPHHDCEIAQTVCATGKEPFVRYWMHTAMVRHEGEKMSKSLGNLIMVRDLLDEGWSPDALRLYMHQFHYRQAWEFDESRLEWAEDTARLLRSAVTAAGGKGKPDSIRGPVNTFKTAMEDDLDTPTAIAGLEQFAHEILAAAERGARIKDAQQALRRMGKVLGLCLDNDPPEERVVAGWSEILKEFA